MKKKKTCLIATIEIGLAFMFAFMFFAINAAAETYPNKPVRVIIPFSPGGGSDIVGRLVINKLSERLGQQVIAANHPGAGGVLGFDMAAHAKPDGYTLVIAGGAFSVAPAIYKSLPYDPLKAFIPIAKVGTGPSLLVCYKDLPVNSVKELIALAKEKPGDLICSSSGVGSFGHLSAELFRQLAGIDYMIMQFKGGGPAIVDTAGGHSQFCLTLIPTAMPHIKSGKLRPLGVGTLRRSSILPDVPTISEAGVPGYDAASWWGLLAPAGTPKEIVEKLEKEIQAIMNEKDIQKSFFNRGVEVDVLGSAEFGKFIKGEIDKWVKVVKVANIKRK